MTMNPDGSAIDAGGDGDGPDGSRASSAASSNRSAILRSGFLVALLIVVFVGILPRFVNYGDVLAAFRALTLAQIALMTAVSAAAFVVSGLLFVVVVPGLGVLRATAAYLILTGIGTSIPFGPWNLGVTWLVLRGWGYPNRQTISGIALYGLLSWLARLVLPPMVLVLLIARGELDGPQKRAVPIALVSGAVFIVATVVIVAIVRSERVGDWIGGVGDRLSASVLRRLGRDDRPDISRSIDRFRTEFGDVLRRRGVIGVVVGVLAQIGWSIVLVVSLRVTGVPAEVLSPGEVFAVYGLVSVITLIPIAPGGAGVPELLFIAGFSALAGAEYTAAITAGVFLFRLYDWFLPIPAAWIMLKLARRGRSILPTTSDLRAFASGESA